jgi:hypothetical protein
LYDLRDEGSSEAVAGTVGVNDLVVGNVGDDILHALEVLSLLSATENRVDRALRELEHLRHGEKGLFPDVPATHWESILAEKCPEDT